MTSGRQTVWALPLLAAVLCAPATATAQTTADSGIGGRPWPAARVSRSAPRAPAPDVLDASIDIPDLQSRDATPADGWDAATNADDAQPGIGRHPAIDGRLDWPAEPDQAIDGRIQAGAPDAVPEPVDASAYDTRLASDAAAFEQPPAGFDRQAFSIEPEPLRDRRPLQLHRLEPYQPLGIRIGSFVLFPAAELGAAAFSNVFRSSSHPRRDVAFEARPSLSAISDWSAHAVELRAEGLATFHHDHPSEDDRGALLEARGRLDLTRRTNLEALASWELVPEARGSINAPITAGERSEVEIVRAAASANHRFNRLSVQLRGSLAEFDYSSGHTDRGAAAPEDRRDYVQKEVALRAGWRFKPDLSLFAETAVNARDYQLAAPDGIERHSSGVRHRLGVSFGSDSAILRGEASIGLGRQRFDDTGLPDVEGILVDANVAWRASALTSLLLRARTDVTESLAAGAGGALSRMAGLELRHAFLCNLIGSAGTTVTWLDYKGISLREQELIGLLALEYHLSREVALFGRYEHIAFDSSERGRSFNADEIRIGVRVRR